MGWLNIIELGAKTGLGVFMLTQAMETSDPVPSLLSGGLCISRIAWIIAHRILPDL